MIAGDEEHRPFYGFEYCKKTLIGCRRRFMYKITRHQYGVRWPVVVPGMGDYLLQGFLRIHTIKGLSRTRTDMCICELQQINPLLMPL